MPVNLSLCLDKKELKLVLNFFKSSSLMELCELRVCIDGGDVSIVTVNAVMS